MRLLQAKQLAHALHVGFVHQAHVREVAFLLLRLFRQDVAFVSMFPFNFPCSGKSESFFGTGVSLHFRHFYYILNYN